MLFGSVVLALMCIAFWVVQLIANKLVIGKTRQIARDYSFNVIERIHTTAILGSAIPKETFEEKQDVLKDLEKDLLNDDYKYEIIGLPDRSPTTICQRSRRLRRPKNWRC